MADNETLGALLALATGLLGLATAALELGKAALRRRRERRAGSGEEGGCDTGAAGATGGRDACRAARVAERARFPVAAIGCRWLPQELRAMELLRSARTDCGSCRVLVRR